MEPASRGVITPSLNTAKPNMCSIMEYPWMPRGLRREPVMSSTIIWPLCRSCLNHILSWGRLYMRSTSAHHQQGKRAFHEGKCSLRSWSAISVCVLCVSKRGYCEDADRCIANSVPGRCCRSYLPTLAMQSSSSTAEMFSRSVHTTAKTLPGHASSTIPIHFTSSQTNYTLPLRKKEKGKAQRNAA